MLNSTLPPLLVVNRLIWKSMDWIDWAVWTVRTRAQSGPSIFNRTVHIEWAFRTIRTFISIGAVHFQSNGLNQPICLNWPEPLSCAAHLRFVSLSSGTHLSDLSSPTRWLAGRAQAPHALCMLCCSVTAVSHRPFRPIRELRCLTPPPMPSSSSVKTSPNPSSSHFSSFRPRRRRLPLTHLRGKILTTKSFGFLLACHFHFG